MKQLKWILAFVVFIIISFILLSFLAPKSQKATKEITINLPAATVYNYLKKTQHFYKWSVWSSIDSTIKYSLPTNDGTVGAISTWVGSMELSGSGTVKIDALRENEQVVFAIDFTEPEKMQAYSNFQLRPLGAQMTQVIWTFEIPSKRPWNIFNLFVNLEKEKGKDFEAGLQQLKKIIESTTVEKPLTVHEVQFPETKYVAMRQLLVWADFKTTFPTFFHHLKTYPLQGKMNTAKEVLLFFSHSDSTQQSDVAAAVAVPASFSTPLKVAEKFEIIKSSKAIEVQVTEDKKGDAFAALDAYLQNNKLVQKRPMIEERVPGDTARMIKIIYLLQ